MLQDILETIWNIKIQILPALLAIMSFEGPNIIRRLSNLYYVPIYFSIFPLKELNSNLSIYLGEDYFLGLGAELNADEISQIKRKIMIDAAISMLLSAVLIPLFAGFIWAIFFDDRLFLNAIVIVILYKLYRIYLSLKDFSGHAIGSRRNLILLAIIYFFYVGVLYQMTINAYNWTRPFILTKNYLDMFKTLSDLLFNRVIGQGLILAALAAFFGNLITDKKIRDENIKNNL